MGRESSKARSLCRRSGLQSLTVRRSPHPSLLAWQRLGMGDTRCSWWKAKHRATGVPDLWLRIHGSATPAGGTRRLPTLCTVEGGLFSAGSVLRLAG